MKLSAEETVSWTACVVPLNLGCAVHNQEYGVIFTLVVVCILTQLK